MTAELHDLGGGRFEADGPTREQSDGSTFAGESTSERSTDSSRGTGDDDDFSSRHIAGKCNVGANAW